MEHPLIKIFKSQTQEVYKYKGLAKEKKKA